MKCKFCNYDMALHGRFWTCPNCSASVEDEMSYAQRVSRPTLEHLHDYLCYQYPPTKGNIPLEALCKQIAGLEPRIKVLDSAVAEMTEMLDWLEKNPITGVHFVPQGMEERVRIYSDKGMFYGKSFRDALKNAMKGKK